MTNIDIILNERTYIENCLANHDYGKNAARTLYILAKYYYSQGMKPKEIEDRLNDFMNTSYPRYNPVKWYITIDKVINKAKKKKLIEVEGVYITESELKTIKQLSSKPMQRLLFTMTCVAKYFNAISENNNNWVNLSWKEFFKLARIQITKKEQCLMLHELYKLNLIDFSKQIANLNVKLTFIDNDSEPVLYISDFRELGYEYLSYCGESFVRCKECGRLTRQNKQGTVQFCKEHRGYVPKETKVIKCIDCGNEVKVSSMSNNRSRCDKCIKIKKINDTRIRVNKYRSKM